MAIEIQSHPAGVVLPVRVSAGARQTRLVGEQAGALKLAVSQAPEKGKANKAIVALLCELLGLKKSQVELLSGATSAHKRFLVRDISTEELSRRVDQQLAQSSRSS